MGRSAGGLAVDFSLGILVDNIMNIFDIVGIGLVILAATGGAIVLCVIWSVLTDRFL